MRILTIKLTAPLQSYGNEATFLRRTTHPYPTKSAVIGMIAAALGYRRTDQRIQDLNTLSFAVRVDQVGTTLTDFQTVEWKPGTRKITYRDYLQDAVFMVAIGSDNEQLIKKINNALQRPRFQLFLGRRANVPAGLLQLHQYTATSPVAVLQHLVWEAATWYQRRRPYPTLEIIADAKPDQAGAVMKDQVVSFDQRHRQHRYRVITKSRVALDDLDPQSVKDDTQHDAMKFLEGN